MTIAALEALTFGLGRMVAAADAAGERLCLLTGHREIYRHELSRLSAEAVDVVDVDTDDVEACAAVLADLPKLAGLINSTDTWLVRGAELAARLGVPGLDPAAARLLRDKVAVRARLAAAGLSRGAATAVPAGPDGAAVVRTAVSLPAVLKDSAGTGSRDVWPVYDPAEVDAVLAEAADRQLMGRLFAEPLLTGPLYSAETVSWDGCTRLLGVTGRLMSAQWFGREELMSFPVHLPWTAHADLADWVGRVLAAAGYTHGFAHVEFVDTVDGPQLVEINARIGGCLTGEALCRWSGGNVYESMLDMTVGRRPRLLDTDHREPLPRGPQGVATATVLVYPHQPGTYTGIRGLARLPEHPGNPQWYPTMPLGREISHLGDQRACAGLLMAEAPTTEIALYRAVSAAGCVRPLTGRSC